MPVGFYHDGKWIIATAVLVFVATTMVTTVEAAEACRDEVARLVSLQGHVEIRKAGHTHWQPVDLNDLICAGDFLRIGANSRAAVLMGNDAVLRIDQKSTLNFRVPEKEKSYLDAKAAGGTAEWTRRMDDSLARRRKGDLAGAFDAVDQPPSSTTAAAFFTYRASLYLHVGQVEAAREDIQSALKMNPSAADAIALQSIVAIAQNRKVDALELARRSWRRYPVESGSSFTPG
jgi:tetratricopeptide (TPR) repeat protein